MNCSATWRPEPTDAMAVVSARSAAWSVLVSMKRRYHPASRSGSSSEVASGASGKRSGCPRVSARHERQSVNQRQRPVGGIEPRQQVRHGHQHRQPGAPPGPSMGGAELDAQPHRFGKRRLGKRRPVLEQTEDRLGGDQRQVLLESFGQSGQPCARWVTGRRRQDEDPAVADLHRIGADVVGEGIQGAARAQVEAGVVPVARDQSVFNRASMEREAQVGATIVDGVGPTPMPDDTDPVAPDLDREHPPGLEFAERAGIDSVNRFHSGMVRGVPGFNK